MNNKKLEKYLPYIVLIGWIIAGLSMTGWMLMLSS